MAESEDKKNQKLPASFADDLDSMLNFDDALEQKVELVDDDDAIDKLLIDDAFELDAAEDVDKVAAVNDIEQVITNEVEKDTAFSPEFDEFGDDIDDLIADIQLNPKQQKSAAPTELPVLDDVAVDEVDQSALETVGEFDAFDDDKVVGDELVEFPEAADETMSQKHGDVLENMAEIDEFSENAGVFHDDNADFLMADFDISADDEFGPDDQEPAPVSEKINDISDEFVSDETEAGGGAQSNADGVAEGEPSVAPLIDEGAAETRPDTDEEAIEAAVSAVPAPAMVDYAAMIAGLSAQLGELKKQQAEVEKTLQLKSDKDELVSSLESIDSLQSEQKKAKRNIDALVNKKPVSAYVANGLALLALIVGGSLGYQGYQAKSQVAQIIDYLGKMQAQINAAPTADAAEKEMLRSQLDELARANSVASEQIAELTKLIQGDSEGNPAGGLGKQFAALNQQDMQMGAAIESLQSKVAALEKGKVSAAAVKPAPKKPVVEPDNWVVNLVAFKQDWYAKRKAEEYAGKGVPAKVSRADAKGETWYRLSVDGFKSQYEAAAYAARVKKTLNLDSVWINKNKN